MNAAKLEIEKKKYKVIIENRKENDNDGKLVKTSGEERLHISVYFKVSTPQPDCY